MQSTRNRAWLTFHVSPSPAREEPNSAFNRSRTSRSIACQWVCGAVNSYLERTPLCDSLESLKTPNYLGGASMTETKYVAFDVHTATIVVVVLDGSGKLMSQAVIKTEATAVRDLLRGLSGEVHLTFEEGTQAQWLYELTRPLVAKVVVCNVRQWSTTGNKNDKLDALKLAQALRGGQLKTVYHGSPSTQTLKQLAHNYDAITADRTRCMNRLKSLYRSQAIVCSGAAVYSKRSREAWLGKLSEAGRKMRAEFLYQQLESLSGLRREAKKELLKEAQKHLPFKRLCGVHGLGPVRVSQIIAEVGSPIRFRTKRQLWSYCGLSVVTRSSADYEFGETGIKRRTKNIQTRGLNQEYNRRLKRVFKSAALQALKEDSIKKIYSALTGKGVRAEMAMLTVARKLAAVTLAVWKSGEEFDEKRLTKQVA
jgi:transposase